MRQDHPRRSVGLECPRGLAVRPRDRALRKQREALVAAWQRAVTAAGLGLERGQHPLVEDEASAGGARQHAAHDVAGGAARTGEQHGQRRGRRERALQGGLVLLHERAALDGDAAGGQRGGHRGGVVVDERQRRPDRHQADAGRHSHPIRRARRSSRSA